MLKKMHMKKKMMKKNKKINHPMSIATKILWGFVLLYFALCCLLAASRNVLGMFMADTSAIVVASALGLQLVISTINKFIPVTNKKENN